MRINSLPLKYAKTWSDSQLVRAATKIKHYRWVMVGLTILCAALFALICLLVPLQKNQLIVVHDNQHGYAWVSTAMPSAKIKPNWQRTMSEIARYVATQGSYDPLLYQHQMMAIRLLSSSKVESAFIQSQEKSNPNAPINTLGVKGYRTVVLNSIFPLSKSGGDNSKAINLAQVNFELTDHFFQTDQVVKKPYTALISWRYLGVPKNPTAQLLNWDGFQVTEYKVEPVNIH